MMNPKLFLNDSRLFFRYIALYIFLIINLVIATPAQASFGCSDGATLVSSTICAFGKCGICEPNTGWDGWMIPQAQVIYQPGNYGASGFDKLPVYHRTVDLGTCVWMVGVRFCVRPVQSGEKDGTSTDPNHVSNNSGHPQICAYEDPCDGMDPPDGNCAVHSGYGPFRFKMSNSDALSLAKSAQYGAMGGGVGVIIGVMMAGIQSDFNHSVTTAIGCIDRKIGPTPPAWSNNAWFSNSLPMPTFEEQPSSKFEAPVIKVKVCHQTSGTQSIVACGGTGVEEYTAASVTLNPLPTSSATTNYIDCKYTNDGSNNGAGRKWCAKVTQAQPDKVIITSITQDLTDPSALPEENQVASIDRPGYIPKPTVTEATTSTFDAPKLTITLRNKSITLDEDKGLEANPPTVTAGKTSTDYLHQVQFTAQKPCVFGQTNANGTCNQYQNMLCAIGYSTSPFTDVTINNDTQVAASPNVRKTQNIAFSNTNSHTEPATSGTALSESYKKDNWVYASATGLTDDGVHKLRALNEYEADQCIFTPPDSSTLSYTTPGTSYFTVPVNCTQVAVQVWGGGAAGQWQDTTYNSNDNTTSSSGGGGGYIAGTFTVDSTLSPAQQITVVVGAGGATKGANGGDSKVSIGGTIYATANKGTAGDNNGVGQGGAFSNISSFTVTASEKGGDGINPGENNNSSGGSSYGTSGQSKTLCNDLNISGASPSGGVGAGGCSHGDHSWSYHVTCNGGVGTCTRHDEDPGSWGVGGNGKVTIQCTRGMN